MKRDYERSSGNVFADLGFRNSEQELRKAKLTVEIYRHLRARGITQQEAGKLLGTTQAQVSALMRCEPVSVSVGRLMEFLTVLGQDVKVTVKIQRLGRRGRAEREGRCARGVWPAGRAQCLDRRRCEAQPDHDGRC
jgi:predicted XRE-type DNA-binding protein